MPILETVGGNVKASTATSACVDGAKMSYEEWERRVDAAVERLCGLSMFDLPDYCTRDAYDDGETPSAVAREILRAANK